MYMPVQWGKRRKILTKAARDYKYNCSRIIKIQCDKANISFTQTDTIAMLLVLHPQRYNIDADNHIKIVQDALTMSGVIPDDKIITPTTAVITTKSTVPSAVVYLSKVQGTREEIANKCVKAFDVFCEE